MSLRLAFYAFLCLSLFSATQLNAQEQESTTTYYLIRHSEKETSDKSNRDPELNEIGKQHAIYWAEILKTVSFDAIYSTNYIRTQKTAEPIAKQQQLPFSPTIRKRYLMLNFKKQLWERLF